MDQTIQPFQINGPYLYPLKKFENQRFYYISKVPKGYKKGKLAWTGLIILHFLCDLK